MRRAIKRRRQFARRLRRAAIRGLKAAIIPLDVSLYEGLQLCKTAMEEELLRVFEQRARAQ